MQHNMQIKYVKYKVMTVKFSIMKLKVKAEKEIGNEELVHSLEGTNANERKVK